MHFTQLRGMYPVSVAQDALNVPFASYAIRSYSFGVFLFKERNVFVCLRVFVDVELMRSVNLHSFTKNIHSFAKNIHSFAKNIHSFTMNLHSFTNNLHSLTKNVHSFTNNLHNFTEGQLENPYLERVPPGPFIPRCCE